MKTILITGGGGFIGSNLVASLLERGDYHVVVCDIFGSSNKWRNLRKHPVHEIITPDQLFLWLSSRHADLEMIFHLGGISSTVEKNIDLILESNFTLSLDLWRWANEHKVRFAYTSSYAVYGNGEQGFDDTLKLEYLKSLRPMSGYGWSKNMFDIHVAAAVARNECMVPQWVGLKIFNAYGPNEYHKDDNQSVISKIAPHAIQGGIVKLFRSNHPSYTDGGQKRDVIYVKDCVRVLLWVLDNANVSGLFNLGSGKASTFNEMANAIFAAIGREPKVHYIDMPDTLAPHYQNFTEANMQRLRDAGYTQPFTPLTEGIRDYVQNYLVKADSYR